MRIGLDIKHEGIANGLIARDILDLAVRAETAGFESVWTNEDVGYDSTAVLAAISQRTQTIQLGTAVINVYSRSAMQLAMAAVSLDELSGGRLILGLSIGHSPWNDRGHGLPMTEPLNRLREYLSFLRKAVTGQPFTHDGPVFRGVDTRLQVEPVRAAVPIHVAGERPRIIALAGELADGLIINVVSADYIARVARPQFRSSAEQAGRDPDQLELTALVTCCIADDPDEALRWARSMLVHRLRRSLKMLDTQPEERHEEIRRLHSLMLAGRREEAAASASEELVRSVIAAGAPGQVAAAIGRYAEAGCTRVVAATYPRGRADVERTIAALGPALSRSGGGT